ncbi:universal stress protein UspA [Sulfolobales archaeon HS-7]|nr:universal stress protein UspA [Sulfolobales archaeon HS-7]
MVMFKKVLVGYDGSSHSKKALEVAVEIASKFDADLYIVEAVDTATIIGMGQSPIPQELIDQLFSRAKDDVKQASELAKGKVHSVSGEVLDGDPANAILEYAERVKADLIVTGTRGLSTWKKLFLGSVSSRIVSESKVPVLVVR